MIKITYSIEDEMMISALDYSLVAAHTKKYAKDGAVREHDAFMSMLLDHIFPNKPDDNIEIITDGTHDRGVDAIYISQSEQSKIVNILSFKYRTSLDSAQKNFGENELNKIFSFITDLMNKDRHSLQTANAALQRKCEDVWQIWENGDFCQFRVFLVSNGRGLNQEALVRMDGFCKAYDRLSYEQVDLPYIVRLLTDEQRPTETAKIAVIDKAVFDRSDGDIKGVVATVDAISFLKAISTPDLSGVKRYLFDENIRIYLGDEGGFNQSIIKSALAEDNHLFWYLNNGITIVCDRVDYQKQIHSPIITIENFQIVNGAQTCHALFSAFQKERDKISNVILLVKIFETKRNDIANRVAIATNSQTRINPRDLYSNDDLQRRIEAVLRPMGYWYERKKNQYSHEPKSRRIDALKLGQIILSYMCREPDKAKTESDTIFGARYNQIFHGRYDSDHLVSLIKLMEIIEHKRDEFFQHERNGIIDLDNQRFLAYGQWYILFATGLVAEKYGYKIPTDDNRMQFVEEAIDLVGSIAAEYKTQAHYDMFRSSRFRDRLLAEFDPRQLRFYFPESITDYDKSGL